MSSPTPPPAKSFAAHWAGWAVAAILAAIASYLGTLYLNERAQLGLKSEEAQLASLELRSLQQQVEANRILTGRQITDLQNQSGVAQLKIAKLISPVGDATPPIAIVIWNQAGHEGLLLTENLPAASDQKYQLWLVHDHHSEPVSAGIFSVDDPHRGTRFEFRDPAPLDTIREISISLQRGDGSSTARGPTIALGHF